MAEHCNHNRASNAEVDFIVDGIVAGKYLFAPCEATDSRGKRYHQCPDILDGQTLAM